MLVESMVSEVTQPIHAGVINKTTVIDDSELLQQTIVCTKQAREHAAPVWGWEEPTMQWLPSESAIKPGMNVGYAFDDSDAASALAYHDVDPLGVAFFKDFVRTSIENGADPTTVLGHEFLEMCGDSQCDQWVLNPADGFEYAQELCDAVEGDEYELDGRKVTNFVYPNFFVAGSQGPYDHMGLVTEPFQTRPGGYQLRRKPGTGNIEQVNGDKREAWRDKGKDHPAARTAKRKSQTGAQS